MNPDDILNDVTVGTLMIDKNYGYSVATPSGLSPLIDGNLLTTTIGASSVTVPATIKPEDALDQYAMNRFAVDHKVTAQELLKLQEVAPDYAKEIKENIAKNLARDIATKVSYTKKHDKDTDVHHFIGRVWVFSEEELKGILGIK